MADLAQRAADDQLPAAFGSGHLFIDSCPARTNCLI
jgi:hypothetical protein